MSFDKPSIAGHRLTDKFLARANLHGPRAIDYPISSFTTWRSGPGRTDVDTTWLLHSCTTREDNITYRGCYRGHLYIRRPDSCVIDATATTMETIVFQTVDTTFSSTFQRPPLHHYYSL